MASLQVSTRSTRPWKKELRSSHFTGLSVSGHQSARKRGVRGGVIVVQSGHSANRRSHPTLEDIRFIESSAASLSPDGTVVKLTQPHSMAVRLSSGRLPRCLSSARLAASKARHSTASSKYSSDQASTSSAHSKCGWNQGSLNSMSLLSA